MSKKIFFKGVSYSYLRQITSLITGIISLPILLNYFGSVNYGIWVLILGLTGYINTISFGIPSAMSTLVANSSNLKNKYLILKKSFELLLVLSLSAVIVFVFSIYFNSEWILSLLGNIDEESFYVSKTIFVLFVIFTLIKLPFDLFVQFFSGMNAVYNSEIYFFFKILVSFFVVLSTMCFTLNFLEFAVFWMLGDFFISFISSIHVYVKYSYLRKENINEMVTTKKDILKSGFAFFQVGLAASLVWSTDNLVISHFLSPEFVTPYSIAFKIFTYMFMFSAILNGVVAPMYGNAYAVKDFNEIRKLSNFIYKVLPSVGACVWIFLILFSKEIILFWTGSDDAFGGYLLFFSLGLYGYALSYVNTYATLLYSFNLARKIYSIAWLEAILNLVLSLILIQYLGIGGVALGTAISALVISLMLPKLIKKLTNQEVTYESSFINKKFVFLVLPFLILCMLILELSLIYKVVIFILFSFLIVFVNWKSLSLNEKVIVKSFFNKLK